MHQSVKREYRRLTNKHSKPRRWPVQVGAFMNDAARGISSLLGKNRSNPFPASAVDASVPPTNPESHVGQSEAGFAQSYRGALAIGLAIALTLVVVTFKSAAGATGDSVAVHCARSALAAVGPSDGYPDGARQWRSDRKLKFERCVDASLQGHGPMGR